ncbi:hypothetical protein RB597_004720 [Gaeumannomyces tritici]
MAATNEDQGPHQEASKYFWEARTDHQSSDWVAQFGIKLSHWVPNPLTDVYFTPRTLHHDLAGYTPTRIEIALPHAEWERKDSWFEETFRHLYWATYTFSVRRFGQHNFRLPMGRSPWADAELSPQFLSFASQLSRQDPLVGGWDHVLKDKTHRACLVTGIISKVLVENVFNELLWGATDQQTWFLRAHDEATLSDDGFKRTKRRAQIVRDMLGGDLLSPNFWPRVDALAYQVTSLLLPLINFQGQQTPTEKWPGLMVIYQELHDIIAEAAYFSICIRLSHTIFHIEYPEPGDKWELDYSHLEPERIYQKSKSKGQKYDMRQGNDDSRRYQRIAKVKVIAWPQIKRHEPLGSVEHYGAENGQRVALVSRCEVAYYYGMSDDQGEMWERKPTLTEHVLSSKKTTHRIDQARSFLIPTLGLLAVISLSALISPNNVLLRGFYNISYGVWWAIAAVIGGLLQIIGGSLRTIFGGPIAGP